MLQHKITAWLNHVLSYNNLRQFINTAQGVWWSGKNKIKLVGARIKKRENFHLQHFAIFYFK